MSCPESLSPGEYSAASASFSSSSITDISPFFFYFEAAAASHAMFFITPGYAITAAIIRHFAAPLRRHYRHYAAISTSPFHCFAFRPHFAQLHYFRLDALPRHAIDAHASLAAISSLTIYVTLPLLHAPPTLFDYFS